MTVELQDVINLALQLSPRQRMQLIEQVASSVEDVLPGPEPSVSDHWGQSLHRLLEELGPVEMKNPEFQDPVEWVKEQQRDLLSRARHQALTEHELQNVVQALKSSEDLDIQATLILILGWAQAKEFESEVAAVLEKATDSVIQKQALETLCFYWGLTHKYLVYVRKFLQTPPDENRSPWIIAVSVAGEYLTEHEDCDLLRLLYDCYKDENAPKHQRQHAYEALHTAYGAAFTEVLADSNMREDVIENPNPDVIQFIQQQLDKC